MLGQVATLELSSGPALISRYDRARNVNFEIELSGMPLGEVTHAASQLPSLNALPPGVRQTTVGDAEVMEELFASFGLAMLTGVLCIYIVLVLLFKDVLQPGTILAALPQAVSALAGGTILPAAEGIVTTDLYPKIRRADVGGGSIVGIAKGAGMIEPNLATMLVYVLTDLAVPRGELRAMLAKAIDASFNAISIDSDTSTSDTVALISSGRVPCEDFGAFERGLHTVCRDLAEDVVRNGEGVRHVIRVRVTRAASPVLARALGKAIVNAPLFKCAVAGNDPNVGRLVQAIGKHIAKVQIQFTAYRF